jgi:hypothetical protein
MVAVRKPMLSRYYIQCDLEARLEDWPDDRFWQEFRARCNQFDYLHASEHAQASLAEQYVGLPFEA